MHPILEHEAPALAIGAGRSVDKMPAHWLMARLGKRVLRPGGRETTRWMLDALALEPSDQVVEIAPGLGLTAAEIIGRAPTSYVGVEREPAAVDLARGRIVRLGHPDARVVHGDASRMPLPDASATAVVGEAMLSMQVQARKEAILSEVARVLKPGGRYAIHELAVAPDGLPEAHLQRIEKDLAETIHVGVRIGTVSRWQQWLGAAGFAVEHVRTAPMRLLEPDRLLQDEGLLGTARFIGNALKSPAAARRLRAVRSSFRRHADHLCAVALVARRNEAGAVR